MCSRDNPVGSENKMGESNPQTHSSACWDLSQMVLSKDQHAIACDLQTWLSTSTLPLAQSIASWKSGSFSIEEMHALEQAIIKKFAPLPDAAKYLLVLCKAVDAINDCASPPHLPSPRIPTLSARPKNPFRVDLISSLSHSRTWRNVVSTCKLPEGSDSESESIRLGMLFSSAVLHGGLCSPDSLVALYRAVKLPAQHILWSEQQMLIELSISWQGEAGSEHRFWFPDALSATLIARCLIPSDQKYSAPPNANTDSDEVIRKRIWNSVKSFFSNSDIPTKHRPRSLTDLTRKAKIDLHSRLPQVLANFAGRNLISHSPSRQVLTRIHNLPCTVERPTAQEKVGDRKDLITSFNQEADNLESLEPQWLKLLRLPFSKKDGNLVAHRINEIVSNWHPDSPGYCFALFTQHLISGRSASNNKLAPSTARAYMVTVSKHLGGRLGLTDPRSLDTETLESLYLEILEDADINSSVRKQRRQVARALREFHHFLVQKFDTEPINTREILGIGKGLVPVDANLITFDEYEAILTELPKSVRVVRGNLFAQAKLVGAARLILMLSFKCGLRRMEVLKLKLVDVCEHDPAELLVRPSDARGLKTISSTRKMPLYALLSKDELEELRRWKQARLFEISGESSNSRRDQSQDDFLFGIPELGFDFIPQDTIISIIHYAMREVTKDSSLRFHHLRHSFSSWLFFRLMLSDLPNASLVISLPPRTTAYLNDSVNFRNRLYGRSDLTRRHTYSVASLLGHSGPDVSLEHYVHFCGHLLAQWLTVDVSTPKIRPLLLNTPHHQSTTYRWIKKSANNVSFRLAKKRRAIPALNLLKKQNSAQILDTATNSIASALYTTGIFDLVWDILHRHALNHTPIDELSSSSDMPESSIAAVIKKAEELAAMKTEKGKGGFRHRMISATLDRRESENLRLACPIAPNTESDKEIVRRLSPKLIEAFRNNPTLCESVIDFYVKNVWNTRNEVIFKNPDNPTDAIKFLEFLRMLGFTSAEIQYVSFDTSPRSRSLPKWKSALGLSKRVSVTKLSPPNKGNTLTSNWFGIKPSFQLARDPSMNSRAAAQGSIAFRYLMIMFAIVSPLWKADIRLARLNSF